MRLLLDTHALLWALSDDPRLSAEARHRISDPATDVVVSSASAWEISIKQALGKLDAPDDLADVIEAARMRPLPITVSHALLAGRLPRHHDDPFDRMLVAQAVLEGLILMTSDRRLNSYEVDVVPA